MLIGIDALAEENCQRVAGPVEAHREGDEQYGKQYWYREGDSSQGIYEDVRSRYSNVLVPDLGFMIGLDLDVIRPRHRLLNRPQTGPCPKRSELQYLQGQGDSPHAAWALHGDVNKVFTDGRPGLTEPAGEHETHDGKPADLPASSFDARCGVVAAWLGADHFVMPLPRWAGPPNARCRSASGLWPAPSRRPPPHHRR